MRGRRAEDKAKKDVRFRPDPALSALEKHTMKNLTKKLVTGTVIVGLGGSAFGEALFGAGLAIGLKRRLLIKAAESLVDAATRKTVEFATAPEVYEAYDLQGQPCSYQDEVFGVYRGSPMAYTLRRTWLDPISGTQHFGTWSNGTWKNAEPFPFTLHNRNYRCLVPGTAGYDLSIRAKTSYWIENVVTRVDLNHAVWSHPVRWTFGLALLPATCQDSRWGLDLSEHGSTSLVRGGRHETSSFFENVDFLSCLVTYDEK